jgi:predicted transcriptional regulator YdeE
METKITQIEEDIMIGGLSIETDGDEKINNKNRKTLFNDFIHNGIKELVNSVTKNNQEYYVVTWVGALPKIHYLLGQKIGEKTDRLDYKIIRKGEFASKKVPAKRDSYTAWMEFYTEDIPKTGYNAVEQDDIAFEYYPNGLDEEYELWVLVEKA